MTDNWQFAAKSADIDEDDVIQVEIDGRALAIYNVSGRFYATDGSCTHEHACLADGLVLDGIIECPLHQGRFDIATGAAKGAPASIALKTYPARIDGDSVLVRIDG